MYMTKKEKKAIFEAIQQIRENQRRDLSELSNETRTNVASLLSPSNNRLYDAEIIQTNKGEPYFDTRSNPRGNYLTPYSTPPEIKTAAFAPGYPMTQQHKTKLYNKIQSQGAQSLKPSDLLDPSNLKAQDDFITKSTGQQRLRALSRALAKGSK